MELREQTCSTALPFHRKPRCGSRPAMSFASKLPAVAAGEKEMNDDLGARVVVRVVGRRDLGPVRRGRCRRDHSRPGIDHENSAAHGAWYVARRAPPPGRVIGCPRVLEATPGPLGVCGSRRGWAADRRLFRCPTRGLHLGPDAAEDVWW